uniref:Uncharacterized protein n=1 Tax=Amphimedon queenslandica TaxID=400682 RepID=A0A1X7VFT7_AMPQE
MTVQDIREALIAASFLVGNDNAKLTRLRREKLISAINSDLTLLIQGKSQFTDSNPYLFGSDFAEQAKEYLDRAGVLKTTTPDVEHNRRSPFCKSLPWKGNWPEKGTKGPKRENKGTIKEHGTSEGEYKCDYSVSGSCNGDNTPKYTYKSSKSADTFPIKLGKSNKGPVGPNYSEGVRNRSFVDNLLNPKALLNPIKSNPLSPIRSGLSPMGLNQDPQADSSSQLGAGDTVGSLHSPYGRNKGESQ